MIRTAVIAALAGSASMAANATNFTIHMSGASAQRSFWEQDLAAISTGNRSQSSPGPNCVLYTTSPTLTPAVPDVHAMVCSIQSSTLGGGNINSGDQVTMYYEAEFGSVWGIAQFVPGTNANTRGGVNTPERLVLDPLAATPGVPAATCHNPIVNGDTCTVTVTGYSRDADTATSGMMGPLTIDVGVADMEPILWKSQDNWPYNDGSNETAVNGVNGTGTNGVVNILSIPGQGQPSEAQLATLQSQWKRVNAQTFSVIVDNNGAPTNTITNLSRRSLTAIFTGAYKTWAQVPEVGTGGSIVVCRRDHGSGSQVSASVFYTQKECGGTNGITVDGGGNETVGGAGTPPRMVSQATVPLGAALGALDQTVGALDGTTPFNPIENFSTNDVKACLAANPGVSIGVVSLGIASATDYFTGAYRTVSIDGIQANAHNAAAGLYPDAFITWAFDNSANSGHGAQAAVGQLLLDAAKTSQNALATEAGGYSGGQYLVSAGTKPITNFYIQDNGFGSANLKPTATTLRATGNTPTASWKQGASNSSCTQYQSSNN
jgi:ABC-type phosphate transport system substrate-binding protein